MSSSGPPPHPDDPFSLPPSISSSVLAAEDIPELEEQSICESGGVIFTTGITRSVWGVDVEEQEALAGENSPRKVNGSRARVSKTPEGRCRGVGGIPDENLEFHLELELFPKELLAVEDLG